MNGSQVRFGWPLLGIVIAGMGGWFASEVSKRVVDQELRSEVEVLRRDFDQLNEWKERTQNNRFTNLDGERLRTFLLDKVALHAALPAHSDVLPRLTTIEVRVREIERTHNDFYNKENPR